MSDLQCAATLLLVPYGEVPTHAQALSSARVARVWAAATDPARRAADVLAADLGVGVTTSGDLAGAEPSAEVMGEIADQHRGETVVVVVDRGDAVLEVVIDGDGLVSRRWQG